MKSIALINCWFGEFPWYFEYFVHSVKFNPSIDFFIITNNPGYKRETPENLKIIHSDYTGFNKLASEKFSFNVNVKTGYKLNDFKPAYAYLFPELVEHYDFWGYIDIDIVFGDIRAFMTDDLLDNYDVISVRPDWITGCFLLFRNTFDINRLFFQSKDFKKVFSEDQFFCFDETGYAHDQFSEGKPYYEVHSEIESMMHVVKKMESTGTLRLHFDLFIIEGTPGNLVWENGKMYFKKKFEILFYHLIFFKKRYSPPKPVSLMPNRFRISPSRIYHLL